jgi:hypothetical protein
MERERTLVQRLASTPLRLDAMRELAGGVTATELRQVTISDDAFAALCEGLEDSNPRVRWWCIQVLDHVPDHRAVAAIAGALTDPVARVRRNAVHALGCVVCKPTWAGRLPAGVLDRIVEIAASDPSEKVRTEAQLALRCHTA